MRIRLTSIGWNLAPRALRSQRLRHDAARFAESAQRINLLMRAIQLARGVLSVHMFAERIRATATFLSGVSAHFENFSSCWVSVRRDSTMI